jgi:sugar phosphate isomerase/epimerase
MESPIDNTPPRRTFLKQLGAWGALAALGIEEVDAIPIPIATGAKKPFFKISLAEWSFNRALKAGTLNNLDFPVKARKDYGLDGVEYVNRFFIDKVKDQTYLAELRNRCKDVGVKSLLIMCDDLGDLAETDAAKRTKTIENHFPWVDAAHFLGCHSIRVNCAGKGTESEVAAAGIDGLRRLSEYARMAKLNVIVENHGGLSSNAKWLANVIRTVSRKNCGTLPDFNNFDMGDGKWYDRYLGVTELMPFAKAVSAKSLDFDALGNCVETDYVRMLTIVKAAGYRGYLGIEYEGDTLSEDEGVKATLRLLQRVGAEMA